MLQDLKNFIEEVNNSKELQAQLQAIVESSQQEEIFDKCNAIAKEHGYTITMEDMKTLADEYESNLENEDLDTVAGGATITIPVIISHFTPIIASGIYSIVTKTKEEKSK